MKPVASSGKAKDEGGAVEVSLTDIARGATRTVEWRCKPVWVVHRTPERIKELQGHIDERADPDSQRDQQPPYAQNATHSIKPEFFIVIGICTHLGGSPSTAPMRTANPSLPTDWPSGSFCPCHGCTFDGAGRIFKKTSPLPPTWKCRPTAT